MNIRRSRFHDAHALRLEVCMSTATRPTRAKRLARYHQQTRLLVATTGGPESRGALHLAAKLAERGRTSVLALGVARPFPHATAGLFSLKQPVVLDEDSRRGVLENVRRATASIDGTAKWEKRALVGMPDDVINDAATTWRATYVILGIGRHSRLDRLFGSETAVAVARKTCVPLIAVPSRVHSLPHRALAAIDFSPASMAAAVSAAKVLDRDGVLVLAHVQPFAGTTSHEGDFVDVYRSGIEAKLTSAVQTLRRATRRQINSVVLGGDPGPALLEYAKKTNCDLIALGGHDEPLIDRLLLGSVRTKVLREAQCSVLIAPPTGVACSTPPKN
jgi:nucleotide-binding universal stress UspA family protein